MGWTGCYKPKGQTMDDFFEKEFSCEFVGKGALVNFGEYYRAYKGKDGKVKVMVCLVQMSRNKEFNFSYKAMNSDMEPFYYNCPERILSLMERPTTEWGGGHYGMTSAGRT